MQLNWLAIQLVRKQVDIVQSKQQKLTYIICKYMYMYVCMYLQVAKGMFIVDSIAFYLFVKREITMLSFAMLP